MDSEKMKEIKKALECMSGLCKDSLSSICFECEIDKKYDEESACKEALTLINELESENKKLEQHKRELQGGQQDLQQVIRELKKRIAELTKELEKEQINNLNCDTELQYKEGRIALLEKDNELLRNAKVVYENVDYCYEYLKKAEKRIAELEKEIEENAFYSKGYAQGIKNTYEVVIPDKLKQFAERLKDNPKIKKIVDEGWLVSYVELCNAVDETLKEFIDELI